MGKITMTKWAVMAGVAALAISANANSIYEIGSVDPGSPAGPESIETGYLTTLIGYYNSATTVPVLDPDGHTYAVNPGSYLSGITTLSADSLVNQGQTSASGKSLSVNVTGYTYLLVKWGNVDELYYVGGVDGLISFSNDVNNNGASHYDLFTGTSPQPQDQQHSPAPEAASTMMLLGGALTSLALVRGKFFKK